MSSAAHFNVSQFVTDGINTEKNAANVWNSELRNKKHSVLNTICKIDDRHAKKRLVTSQIDLPAKS
jgi:hypothetical protein